MGEYDLRKGTCDNLGFEYEDQMIAYLAVAACNQKYLKDFWIANNLDGLGAWDDIVLYTEAVNGQKTLQFLQLKHIANPNKILQFKEYKDEIKKYAKHFTTITSEISNQETQSRNIELLKKTGVRLDDMEFILMTNGEFNDNSTSFSKTSEPKSFIMTNTDGLLYEISSSNAAFKNDVNFKTQFTIISEQSGVTNDLLLNNIKAQLEILITHTDFKHHMEIAKYLPTAIKELFNTKKQTLTVADVKSIISCGILSALKHTKPIDNSPTLDDAKWEIFQKLIKPFQLVVLSNKPDLILKNLFNADNSHYVISCKLTDIKFVINCMKTDVNIKVVMLVPNDSLESIIETGISTLNSLNALPIDSLAPLNDFKIKIQGRETTFGSLFNQISDLKSIFRVDDIIQLLLGKLCVGEDNNFLCYYIPRSIPRIFLKKSIISKIPNFFFIVIVEHNLVETELKIKSYLQPKLSDAKYKRKPRNKETNEASEERLNFQCVKRDAVGATTSNFESKFSNVLVLQYRENGEDFQFEWLSATEGIKEVRNFIEDKFFYVKPMGDNLADLCWNNICKVIIVANPGMGKTYFAKRLVNNCPVDSWVIMITLNEIDFNKTVNLHSWLVDFYTEKLSYTDKQIFKLYFKQKSVVVLFDGFDEVAPDNNVKALTLISDAIKEELKVVVTSREVTKEFLEDNLNTLAYTLSPFSNDDKINFLEKFYSQNVSKPKNLGRDVIENRIQTFALKLLKNCSITNWDEEFTGVPLQCRLLAEGFVEDCQRFCENEDSSSIPINTNLITLFENFIEGKFNIYWKEKGNLALKESIYETFTKPHRKVFFSNHMDAALQIILPWVGINITDEFSEEIKGAKEKHGIIIGLDENKNPVFIHRTFAEYFVAKWFVDVKEGKKQLDDSKRDEYLKFMLTPELTLVKDLFDRILCKQCELHSAILNADLSKVRNIFEKNGNRDDGKCGRNALHLISARGARHEIMKKKNLMNEVENCVIERMEDDKYLEVLDCLLKNSDWRDEKDNVLRWTAQKHANYRNAFGVIDRLLGFEGRQLYNLKNSFMSKWDTAGILQMCLIYDYSNIGTSFLNLEEMDFKEIDKLVKECARHDSVRFAKNVIQSSKCKLQQLSSRASKLKKYSGNISSLHVAAENGSLKTLDVLLKYFNDVNIADKFGTTPLHMACENQHFSVVEALLKKGGNLLMGDAYGYTPIDRAMVSYEPNKDLLEYVTSYAIKIGFGNDINAALPGKNGLKALHYAAVGKNMPALKKLISDGANVNTTDNLRHTPLHLISFKGWFDAKVALYLIESGLNINARNSDGRTALHLAVMNSGNNECVEFLLQHNASANIADNEQQTALFFAVEEEDEKYVELLLKCGADPNITDPQQKTALHWAVCRVCKAEVVELLLQYGANANIVDNKQQTALDLAADFEEQGLLKIFLILWDKTKKELRSKHDALHKSVLKMGGSVEARKKTFLGFPQELSHLVDAMSEAGLIYCGNKDHVACLSCEIELHNWKSSDDPWVKHATEFEARNCQFLIENRGKEFIQQLNKNSHSDKKEKNRYETINRPHQTEYSSDDTENDSDDTENDWSGSRNDSDEAENNTWETENDSDETENDSIETGSESFEAENDSENTENDSDDIEYDSDEIERCGSDY